MIPPNTTGAYAESMCYDPINSGWAFPGLIASVPFLRIDQIIKNTYKTLLTRGMKGCYVYCVDSGTRDYFLRRLRGASKTAAPSA